MKIGRGATSMKSSWNHNQLSPFTYDALTGNMLMEFANPDGFVNSPPIQPLGTESRALPART